MLTEQTVEKLYQMKLYGMARSLKERLERKEHNEISLSDFLGFVVDDEWTYRENNRLASRLRNAHFRDNAACIEDWDHRQPRGLKKSLFLELTQNKWIEKNENVIVTGPCGSGKSYLAQALGQNACRKGFSVFYLWLPKAGGIFNKARGDGSVSSLMRKIAKTNLLILDDWGLVPLPELDRHCILEIVEDRYANAATVITSQLVTSDWHDYLGAGNLADSVCDRLIHNAHRIPLDTEESVRKSKKGLTAEHRPEN
jgi:DNA replication protein DnaC